MDDYAALLARAAQCRRIASGFFDLTATTILQDLARDFEDRAAVAATAGLAAYTDDLGSPAARYVISRIRGGWSVSRGADRIILRPTLQAARDEARRLAAFDDVSS
jgi:hypothetical protein